MGALLRFLVALLAPRLAREAARDLEAAVLDRQADRLARLLDKAKELRAAGHKELADQLVRQAGALAADDPAVFQTRPAGLPDFGPEPLGPTGIAPVLPAPPPAAAPSLPPAPSPSANGGPKRPRGRPAGPSDPRPHPAAQLPRA